MANFYRSEVVTAMREQALVPVFYHPEKEVVMGIVGACARGGSRLVEFTNRGEGAADLFGEVIKACRKEYPKLMVGVGSVRDEITAGIYIGKGRTLWWGRRSTRGYRRYATGWGWRILRGAGRRRK